MHQFICQFCEKTFLTKRNGVRFCSSLCRSRRFNRDRKEELERLRRITNVKTT